VALWQQDVIVSDTTVNELIRKWRTARLSRDQDLLDYPSINILHPEHGIGQGEDEHDPDVDTFQRLVDRLPPDIKAVFEAFHLRIIGGFYCRMMPHKQRARLLGIDHDLYRIRERSARDILRRELLTFFGSPLP